MNHRFAGRPRSRFTRRRASPTPFGGGVTRYGRIAALIILTAAPALAQGPAARPASQVVLSPPNAPKWDASFAAGWYAREKSEIAPDWDDWYAAALFSVSLSRHWTRHLKVEVEVATTTTGTVIGMDQYVFPLDPFIYSRPREHRFRATQVGAGLVYQFFENRWFHPFVMGGLTATYETERASQAVFLPSGRQTLMPAVPVPLDPVDRAATTVRPILGAGLKAYVSERAFIRTDLRATFWDTGADAVTWRGGVGFDF